MIDSVHNKFKNSIEKRVNFWKIGKTQDIQNSIDKISNDMHKKVDVMFKKFEKLKNDIKPTHQNNNTIEMLKLQVEVEMLILIKDIEKDLIEMFNLE